VEKDVGRRALEEGGTGLATGVSPWNRAQARSRSGALEEGGTGLATGVSPWKGMSHNMGHTFSSILLHVVFGTQGRTCSLYKDMREALLHYISGIARNEGVQIVTANAVDDHVHLLLRTKPVHAPSDVVGRLKANSSRWIRTTYPNLRGFAWQSGFSVFSVSESAVPKVVEYIERQVEHHRRMPFAEELRLLLKRHGIEYEREPRGPRADARG
jgi:putative transposase